MSYFNCLLKRKQIIKFIIIKQIFLKKQVILCQKEKSGEVGLA